MRHAQQFDLAPETHYNNIAVHTQGSQIVLDDYCFYGAIMAAMRMADSINAEKLKAAFPEVWNVLQLRYNAPLACLTKDELIKTTGDDEKTAAAIIDAYWAEVKAKEALS